MRMERLKMCSGGFSALLLVLGVGSLFAGCASDEVNPFSTSFGKKKRVERTATQKAQEEEGVVDGDDSSKKISKKIDNSGAAFQAKDIGLLKSSIGSCFGADKLIISDEMLLSVDLNAPPAAETADGKIKFLLPTQYVVGDDIIEKEKSNMVDLASGNRTGIASDGLTDTYLRSLETVANVVAHQCSDDKDECKCGSKDDARIMLTRCLPGLDPNTVEMDEAAEMLGLVCVEGPKGMRKAIASMLSSYSFASAR